MTRSFITVVLMQSLLVITSESQSAVTHPSILEHPSFQSQSLPSGWREVLENHGSSSLIAVMTAFHCPADSGHVRTDIRFINDPLYHFSTDRAVPPGGSLEIGAADTSQCPGGVEAAIFADGHNEGDPDQVKRLYSRRTGVDRAISIILQMLKPVIEGTKSKEELLADLTSQSKQFANTSTIDPDERVGAETVFSQIRVILSYPDADLIVPSDASPKRQPTFSAVSTSQHVSLSQARAIVLSAKLEEWKLALQNNLAGPVTN